MTTEMTRAHRQIDDLLKNSVLGQKAQARRTFVHERLREIIADRWPGAQLEVVLMGSNKTGPILAESNLNFCILDPSRPFGPLGPVLPVEGSPTWRHVEGKPEWYCVHTLADAIEKRPRPPGAPGPSLDFSKIHGVCDGRVPYVRLGVFGSGNPFIVEIMVNYRLGVLKDQLLLDYAELQKPVFDRLYCVVKRWLYVQGINRPFPMKGSPGLSSHAIRLIIARFLQHPGRNLLPDLQDPLLLQQLQLDNGQTFYHRVNGQEGGTSEWDVNWFSPYASRAAGDEDDVRTCVVQARNGSLYRFFCHRCYDPAKLPPMEEWAAQTLILERNFGKAASEPGTPVESREACTEMDLDDEPSGTSSEPSIRAGAGEADSESVSNAELREHPFPPTIKAEPSDNVAKPASTAPLPAPESELGPPNLFGLHRISSHDSEGRAREIDLGQLTARFFPWLLEVVRPNSKLCFHKLSLAINRNGLAETHREHPSMWADSPIVVQDPFYLYGNVASKAKDRKLMQRLFEETKTAVRITSTGEWDLKELLTPRPRDSD